MTRETIYKTFATLTPEEKQTDYKCIEIQDLNHRKKLLTENKIVCIDLYGTWCGPCKDVKPKFAALAQQYNNPGKCLLAMENVDLELTRDCQIGGVPAFIFYKGGQLLKHSNGTPVIITGGDLPKVQDILNNLLSK